MDRKSGSEEKSTDDDDPTDNKNVVDSPLPKKHLSFTSSVPRHHEQHENPHPSEKNEEEETKPDQWMVSHWLKGLPEQGWEEEEEEEEEGEEKANERRNEEKENNIFEPIEPTDREMFDFSGETVRNSNDSNNFFFAGLSGTTSTRRGLKRKKSAKKELFSCDPCFCCISGNLRVWCFVVAVFEIVIFFILLTITAPLAARTAEQMEHYKRNELDEIELHSRDDSKPEFKNVFENLQDLYNYYLTMSICLAVSVILAIIWMVGTGWGYKYPCLVYGLLKPGPLIVIPVYVFVKAKVDLQYQFAIYLLFWIPEIYAIVCSFGIFLQFRAGKYNKVKVRPVGYYSRHFIYSSEVGPPTDDEEEVASDDDTRDAEASPAKVLYEQ